MIWLYDITSWAKQQTDAIHYYGSFIDSEFEKDRVRVYRILDDYQAKRLMREEYEATKHFIHRGEEWRTKYEAGDETTRFTTKEELLERMIEMWLEVAEPGDTLVEYSDFMYENEYETLATKESS